MSSVLLLEDDSYVAGTLMETFALRDIDAVHARTVTEALRIYDPGAFNVLVIDYELPDGTGLDFLTQIGDTDSVTVMHSGLDRSRELAAAGLKVDYDISKGDSVELLDVIELAHFPLRRKALMLLDELCQDSLEVPLSHVDSISYDESREYPVSMTFKSLRNLIRENINV